MSSPTLQVGGVYFKGDEALLVKIGYGSYKGMWMLPGGFVEAGESIEEAVVREVEEEAGINVKPKRIVGLRSGVQMRQGIRQTTVYIVFEVEYLSGILARDENEIEDIKFWKISDIENANEIVELSKEMVMAAAKSRNGLYEGDDINTKSNYLFYNYYLTKP